MASAWNTPGLHYGFHESLVAGTGVRFCREARFLTPHERNLVVVCSTTVDVYRLAGDADAPSLVLAASFELHGVVTGCDVGRIPGNVRDCLFLAFKDAKCSVVEYSPSNHDLVSVSMHAYEDDEMRGGRVSGSRGPLVRVDPEGRCAGMLVYGRKMVVLPLGKVEGGGAADRQPEHRSADRLRSYTIDLAALEPRMAHVVDFAWLPGFYEPTLMILHESVPAWAGCVPDWIS